MSHFTPAEAPPAMGSLRIALLLALSLFALSGCAPAIGDSCSNSTDCSVNGDRVCDIAQPGGYCTVRGCDPDTCPGTAVCVAFRFEPLRTAETWCMDRCKSDGACRQGAGYRCVGADDEREIEPAAGRPYRVYASPTGVLDDIAIREMTLPQPAPGEILLEVCATGINFMNLMGALGVYPGYEKGEGPLGIECAGRVSF